MGDRRVADRRASEEGVFKIEKKVLIIYLIFGTVLTISIIANIILGLLYHNYKEVYESLLSEDEAYYENETGEIDNSYFSQEPYTCDLSIIANKEEVKAGEAIIYEIKAENINAGNGIEMFSTFMDYDTESFECNVITYSDSKWIKTAFVDNYLTMSRKDLSPSQDDQTIAKIAVTVKNDIPEGDRTINLSNIVFTMDDENTFSLPDQSLTVHVTEN